MCSVPYCHRAPDWCGKGDPEADTVHAGAAAMARGAKVEPVRGLAAQVGVGNALDANGTGQTPVEQQSDEVVLWGTDDETVLVELRLAGPVVLRVTGRDKRGARDPRVGGGKQRTLAGVRPPAAEVVRLPQAEEHELNVVASPLPDGAHAF